MDTNGYRHIFAQGKRTDVFICSKMIKHLAECKHGHDRWRRTTRDDATLLCTFASSLRRKRLGSNFATLSPSDRLLTPPFAPSPHRRGGSRNSNDCGYGTLPPVARPDLTLRGTLRPMEVPPCNPHKSQDLCWTPQRSCDWVLTGKRHVCGTSVDRNSLDIVRNPNGSTVGM